MVPRHALSVQVPEDTVPSLEPMVSTKFLSIVSYPLLQLSGPQINVNSLCEPRDVEYQPSLCSNNLEHSFQVFSGKNISRSPLV